MESIDMVQNKRYNIFNAYSRKVDVIKQLRYTNDTGNMI